MDVKKTKFLKALSKAYGIIAPACNAVGISRYTYYRWYHGDKEFREKADEIAETQIDFVESKLMQMIENSDASSVIFYLKTKGKNRGYSDKAQQTVPDPSPSGTPLQLQDSNKTGKGRKIVERKVKNKKDYIVKLLKAQGKYTAELTYQVEITARLLVRADMLYDEILSEGHKAVNIEYSREGNERATINPKEKLYLDVSEKAQKALRALGMNTESKERKTDNDNFNEFWAAMKEDAE